MPARSHFCLLCFTSLLSSSQWLFVQVGRTVGERAVAGVDAGWEGKVFGVN